MPANTTSFGLIYDFAFPESVAQSQKWVLSAIRKYGQELVTMLWRILGNEQDVCDAYQDTFLQLAYHDGRTKPDYIKAYVFRTASNIAISMLRRRVADRTAKSHLAGQSKDSNHESSPDIEFNSKRLEQNLRYQIARLPEHLRTVVILRDLAELSYAAVGKILGISAATARVYRCKAVQLLSVWMSTEKDERP
jgi:RNA polymerase sigma-70 factor (ECF subfamily)